MRVAVVPGPDVDRGRFDDRCRAWGAEVGVEVLLPEDLEDPDAPVVDADSFPSGRGVAGYRWAIRHRAFTAAWPPETAAYGDHPDQTADVREPEQPRGTVVLLHGGFWLPAWGRDLMDGLAVDLARRGWRTVNVSYRRERWPAPGADVLAGLRALASGGAAVVGHSAGAQLGLWATAEGYAASVVVCLAGVCDLAAAADEQLGDGAVAALLGDQPGADADPAGRLPLGAPQVLAHTHGDALVPLTQSRRHYRKATAAGDVASVLEFAGGDHFTLIRPETAAWRAVASALARTPSSNG